MVAKYNWCRKQFSGKSSVGTSQLTKYLKTYGFRKYEKGDNEKFKLQKLSQTKKQNSKF